MTILVTGGAGFIGANFVLDWLAATSEPVVNLDKLTYAGNLESLSTMHQDDRHIFVKGDIGATALVGGLLKEHQPRAVINFAAESHVDRSIHGPGEFIETNIVGTFRWLEAVRGYWADLPVADKNAFRFLHVSTDEVYGSLSKADSAFAETHSYEPNSPYSASKAASDHLVRAWHHTFGLPVLTTNCSNNYGPYHFPEKLIPLMTEDNHKQFWVPPGFAHGFVVLSDTADFLYKTTDYYAPAHERCIAWNDPSIGIKWPQGLTPQLSVKDQAGILLKNAEVFV